MQLKVNYPIVGKCLRLLLLSFVISFSVSAQQSASSEEELKKQAEKAFIAENYDEALSPYSQLLSLYPRNATYNYRYGVALLKAGKNKTNAVSYLEAAAKDPVNPEEVWIYLGQAYMIIGKFDDALGSFRKFESIVNATKLKKFNSEELKANCMNAIELLKTRKNIIIVSSKEVSVNEFYKFYSWTNANGKIVPAAEQFLTTMDKDKQKDPVMFIANDKQTIYLSSYGKKGEHGKDLYIVRKMPNGQWSDPENLGPEINSDMNEDFPYLDKDGRTLYFSSRSKKSIGGYDVFKSKFDFNSGKWSAPENLGWPINTISDDYLYVPIIGTQDAFYTTGINTSKSELEIRRVQLPDQGEALVTITGYYAPTDQKVRRDARITILRGDGNGIVTSVYTDPFTGKYDVTLEPGQDYIIVVEGGGYLPHSESFSLPSQLNNSELKQIVKVTRENTNENLTLENYFYPATAVRDVPSEVKTATYDVNPDSSEMMAVLINNQTVMVTKPGSGKTEELADSEQKENDNLLTIEKKDEYDPTLEKGPTADEIKQRKEEEARAGEIASDSKKSDSYDITIGNEELASIAIMDAKNARQEADSLLIEVERLKTGATERDSLSAQAMAKAETATELDKTAYLNEAYTMKADADNMRRQAADLTIAAIAKDAEAKASEEDAGLLLATIEGGKGKKDAKSATPNSGKADPVISDSNIAQNNTQEKNSPSEEIKELSPSETPVVKNDAEKSTDAVEVAIKSDDNKTNVVSSGSTEEKTETPSETESTLALKDSVKVASEEQTQQPVTTSTESPEQKNKEKEIEGQGAPIQQTVSEVADKGNVEGSIDSINPTTRTENSDSEIASVQEPQKNSPEVEKQNADQGNAQNPQKSVEQIAVNDPSPKEERKEDVSKTVISPVTDTSQKVGDIADNGVKENEPGNIDNTAKEQVQIDSAYVMKTEIAEPVVSEKGNGTIASEENDETISTKENAPVVINENSDSIKDAVVSDQGKTAQDVAVTNAPNNGVTTSQSTTESSKEESTIAEKNKPSTGINQAEGKDIQSPSITTADLADSTKSDLALSEKKISDPEIDPVITSNSSLTETKISEPVNDPALTSKNSTAEQEKTSDVSGESEADKTTSAYVSKVELKEPFIVPVEEVKPFPADINNLKVNPVNEEARIAYQAFKTKYRNAKQLSDQSVELQNRIVNTNDSPEKDSLIFVSNNLTEQSVAMYTEAQDQLKAAQAIDPEVKNKMEVNEQIIAYNSSMPTNSANNSISPTLNQADTRKSEPVNPAKNDSVEMPVVTSSAETANDKTENAPLENEAEKSTEIVAENTAPVVNEYELTPEEARAVDEATTFTVETPNGVEVVKIDTVGINTRHPEFQKYVEVNKEITGKQVETIDVFADAVNQQKLAVEQKQEQNKLMDKAEVEQDRPTKAQIFIKADAYRDSSKKNEEEAAAKFALAQSKTTEVKNKTAEMQEIRKRIAIPGRELPKQATNSKINPQGLTQEELTAMSQPKTEDQPAGIAQSKSETQVPVSNTTSQVPVVASTTPATNYSPEKVQEFAKQSFSISNAPIYNKENPIPMNPPIPDGLVFKVQIGAFRNEIPAEKFQGVQPITAETTRPGWVRYCVGLFQTFEPAVVVKKEMQQRGFKDAFVVAYLNGKRIGLDEAYAMIAKNKSRPDNDYIASSQTEMALLRANNIRPENISSIRNNVIDADEKNFYGENASNVKKSLAVVEYAVQVGVYKTQTTPRALQSLTPLFTEKIRNSLYRFTSDHFLSYASADSMKQIARRAGVRDAFIVVYRNGVQSALASVPVAERNTRPAILAPETSVSKPETKPAPVANTNTLPSFPSATTTGGEIIYRVQLGAFKNNIPFTAVVSFLNVADKGITQQTDDRGLHIFYAGTFTKFSDAAALKAEIVTKGVTDAFVVALQDGKRVVLTDAMKNEVK
ncbi:MAG: hypothetical protein ACO1G9_00305 [Bacteroidota bacterium]